MKTLAFLIDKIDNTKELIRIAALLGKDINAKVQVLHIQNPQVYGTQGYMGATGSAVAPDPTPYYGTQGYLGETGAGLASDQVLLQKIAGEVKEQVAGYINDIEAEISGIHSIEFMSDTGDASAIIKEKVENNAYDMVMLQGQAEQSFWVQNSVIMDVVRNVPCPVYILPPDASYQPLKKIIYATDYNEEDITTLKSLIDLLKPLNPEIMALHVSNDDEFDRKLKSEGFAKMLTEKTGYNNVSVKMIADEDGKDAAESLVHEVENAKADLIVVLKENQNFFERLFKSSFTSDLIKSAQLPVLVFHKLK